MANSYVLYPAAGGVVTDYALPFEYLSQDFVKASVNGVSAPFTFLSTYMIRFSVAPSGALRIYRETAPDPINTYTNGSILLDDNLNASFLQSLHISEEVADNAFQADVDGTWSGQNLRIKNVANPVNPQDVVTKAWAEAVGTGFIGDAAAHAAAALADRNTVAADKAIVAGYKADVAADRATVTADKATVAADKGIVAGHRTDVLAAKTAVDTQKGLVDTAKGLVDAAKATVDTQKGLVDTAKAAVDTAKGQTETARDQAVTARNEAVAAAGSMTTVETQIGAATAQATPLDADQLGYRRNSDGFLRRFTFANLKAFLKTYFDTLYAAATHSHTIAQVTNLQGNLDAAVRADADRSISAGYAVAQDNDGTVASGTYTPTYVGGNFKRIYNNGAFQFAAPTAPGCYNLTVDITNWGAAGVVTWSGFVTGYPKGDPLTTTEGHRFKVHISKTEIGTTASVEALQ